MKKSHFSESLKAMVFSSTSQLSTGFSSSITLCMFSGGTFPSELKRCRFISESKLSMSVYCFGSSLKYFCDHPCSPESDDLAKNLEWKVLFCGFHLTDTNKSLNSLPTHTLCCTGPSGHR